METVSLEITSTQNQLDTKLKNENVKKLSYLKKERRKISETNTTKFTCLMFKPRRPISKTIEFEQE